MIKCWNVFRTSILILAIGLVGTATPLAFAKKMVFSERSKHKTEGDVAPVLRDEILKNFEVQEATTLFHQLNLAKEAEPQLVVANLILEGERLEKQNCSQSKSQYVDLKFTSRLAVAMGLNKDNKNQNLKSGIVRKKIATTGCQFLISSALKSLHRLDQLFFNDIAKVQN